ncbi:hypothetical protein [Bradyrhizobium sp. USDA 3311]
MAHMTSAKATMLWDVFDEMEIEGSLMWVYCVGEDDLQVFVSVIWRPRTEG